jgi:hypothetical protein
MPQVINAPEAVQEEQCHQYDEKTTSLRPIIQPQRRRTGLFTALWSGMTTLLTRPAQSPRAHTTQPCELTVNHIAREQPYLYIEGLSG